MAIAPTHNTVIRKRELIGSLGRRLRAVTKRAALLTNVGMPNLSTAYYRVNIKCSAQVTSGP